MKSKPATHRSTNLQSIGKLTIMLASLGGIQAEAYEKDRNPWNHEIHSEERPHPPIVDPGPAGPSVPAPSDAIILFDGSDFAEWQHHGNNEVRWQLVDRAMKVVPGTGNIETKKTFGDAQLHVEFKFVTDSPRRGQNRGNSGVFFGSYEVQVLDSYENPVYPDGQNASIYGQYPPLVNASRPPGEWQTYNIIYRAPKFTNGQMTEPARFTVFHNNVLVQDNEKLVGPTTHGMRGAYSEHGDVRIMLQDHNDDPVFFRNIWIRELK